LIFPSKKQSKMAKGLTNSDEAERENPQMKSMGIYACEL